MITWQVALPSSSDKAVRLYEIRHLSVGCAGMPITQTSMPPSVMPVLSSMTPGLASATPLLSEATPVPPTVTPVPPTATPKPTATVTSLPPLSGNGGGRIVFSSRRSGDDYDIYVMNADGTDPRRLTQTPNDEEGGTDWSPDGSQIVFTSSRESLGRIRVMNADGSNKHWLTTKGGIDPAWSPDGDRIAFTREIHIDADIYVMNADGTNQQRLTHTSGSFGLQIAIY
ncbi:MAG: hypothetical protein GY832_43000 [Chloroflexi bacterium]|nr:hypothetical protein [Chloroflexota bacterium]